MAISSIPSSGAAQAAALQTQTINKQSQATETVNDKQQALEQARADAERKLQAQQEASKQAQAQTQNAAPPKPVVNTSSQTVGSTISTTA